MPDPDATLTIDPRFAGPPGSANGGWTAGRLAALLPHCPGVEVTLRQPPPLATRLDIDIDIGIGIGAGEDIGAGAGRAVLRFGGAVLAEAVPGEVAQEVVEPVSFDAATEAMSTYAGLVGHPFPGCFACGSDRVAPDGLGLRPGRLPGRPDCVATAWLPGPSLAGPDGQVAAEMVWAALDCPGGWSADLVGRPMVLGRMTAAVDALPRAGDRCVVVGQCLGEQGRKTFTASTAYDADGRVLARARATWITVDPFRLGR